MYFGMPSLTHRWTSLGNNLNVEGLGSGASTTVISVPSLAYNLKALTALAQLVESGSQPY